MLTGFGAIAAAVQRSGAVPRGIGRQNQIGRLREVPTQPARLCAIIGHIVGGCRDFEPVTHGTCNTLNIRRQRASYLR